MLGNFLRYDDSAGVLNPGATGPLVASIPIPSDPESNVSPIYFFDFDRQNLLISHHNRNKKKANGASQTIFAVQAGLGARR